MVFYRYIEIFRSSLSEVSGVLGYTGNNSRRMSMGYSRPGPYDRGDRYGGGGGGGGGGGSGRFQPRSRSFKGSSFSNNMPGMRKNKLNYHAF